MYDFYINNKFSNKLEILFDIKYMCLLSEIKQKDFIISNGKWKYEYSKNCFYFETKENYDWLISYIIKRKMNLVILMNMLKIVNRVMKIINILIVLKIK